MVVQKNRSSHAPSLLLHTTTLLLQRVLKSESGDYPFAVEFKVGSALAQTASAHVAATRMAPQDGALTRALSAALDALLRVKDILDAAKFTEAADEVSQR